MQIDEIETYCYETQRWWVFSGLAGALVKKSGFVTIGIISLDYLVFFYTSKNEQ